MSFTRRFGCFLLLVLALGVSLNCGGSSSSNSNNTTTGPNPPPEEPNNPPPGGNLIVGTGPTVSQARVPGGNFSKIEASGTLNLKITQQATPDMTVEAQANVQSYITTVVEGGVLRIGFLTGFNYQIPLPITVTVRCSEVSSLSVSGLVKAEADGLAADQIIVAATNYSKITVSGSAKDLILDAQGSSKIDASGIVTANQIRADTSGSSEITLSGTCPKAQLKAGGASSISAGALNVDEADLTASGSSKIVLGKAGKVTQSSTNGSTITVGSTSSG